MDRKAKKVFQLDSPFTAVQWPQTSPQNQDTIMEILCSLLSQIGQYRSNHITLSKGKRSKKRSKKRNRLEAKAEDAPTTVVPPPPEISSFIAVGLNSIARSLESSSRRSRPNIQATEGGGDGELPATVDKSREPDAKQGFRVDAKHPLEGHFSVIFVCRSSQSTVLYEHLPQLLYTASLAHPELPATRLVELPNSSEARLCEALGIPRVSFIGIFDGAPHSKSLVDLVRECVPKIEIPWLQQAKESKYLPVKITAIETFSTVAKKGKA